MFEIIMLCMLLAIIMLMVKGEKRSVKISVLTYFTLLSIIMMTGSIYISIEYQLYDAPVEGGFSKHFNWISSFALLFVIPLFSLIGYKLYKWTRAFFIRAWVKWLVFAAVIIMFIPAGYMALFIFILIFYGFAP